MISPFSWGIIGLYWSSKLNFQKFECSCVSPYKGDVCDQTEHPCADVVCENGGVCLENKVSDNKVLKF